MTEADTPTVQLGTTPSGLINPLDALLDRTLPLYPALAQAPNMLACIPCGLAK